MIIERNIIKSNNTDYYYLFYCKNRKINTVLPRLTLK